MRVVLLLLLSLGWRDGGTGVGVLAMRGDAATARDWQPLIGRLNGSVGGEHFRLRPLDLAQMRRRSIGAACSSWSPIRRSLCS